MSFSKLNGVGKQNQDRFNEMEHQNWEQGFEVYDQEFGLLTQQTVPNLLASASFPPTHDNNDDEGQLVRLLDVATGPGFVLSAAVDTLSIDAELPLGKHGVLNGVPTTSTSSLTKHQTKFAS